MTNGVVTHNCPIGKMIHEVGCGGTSPTHYACSKQIETACLPACGGGAYPAGAPNSSPCPLDDATMDEFILRLADGTFTPTATGSYQLHFRYTTSCDMETPDRKCEMSCNHATGCCPVIYINEDVTNNHGPNNPCNAAHDPAPTPCYYAICPTPLDSD